MNPVVGEMTFATATARLSDLAFVMWKDQVFTAGMNVDAVLP